jgi:hypothetical protein
MNRLSAFFKGRNTHLGLVYPENYLLAVFPNLAQADRAQERPRHAGCVEEDVISVFGEEVMHRPRSLAPRWIMGIPDEMVVPTVGDRGGLRG